MNDYFCVLPFFGYEYTPNGGTHCCLLPRNYDIDALRTDMLEQRRSNYCNACWKLEDAGLISDRKLKNSALDFYWDRDIQFIENDARAGKYKPILIKHITSNTCNATCVTCDSGSSTAWAVLEQKMNIVPNPATKIDQTTIDKLDFASLVGLNFVGGEPLYEKTNFYILQKLLDHNNTNCFIQITTNGSVALSEQNRQLLSSFKNINVNISIDGIGPVFEYLRYPLKWDSLLTNLAFFKSITNNVSTSYTTSNLNVLYHHNTIEWFNKQGLNFHYNPVTNPGHFRPQALPLAVKEKIYAKFSKTKDLLFLLGTNHTSTDDKDFAKMLSIVEQQDRIKGISINDYLPEFCELIKSTD